MLSKEVLKMFHNNLRNLRESRGYSQKELADMLSIPVTTYRNYENTLREPSYDILIKIANTLNVSVDELLGIGDSDEKYNKFLFKVKRLTERQFQTLCAFTDFLISYKNSN